MENPQPMQPIKPYNGHMPHTVDDCIRLMQRLPASQMPTECDKYLTNLKASTTQGQSPKETATTPPSSTSNSGPWNIATGHGKRTFFFGKDGFDTPDTTDLKAAGASSAKGTESASVDSQYLSGKSPEVQEKIRQLRTRMSVRGALNVPGVSQEEVEEQKKREMQRRQTRKEELKSKGIAPGFIMPSANSSGSH